MNSVYVEYSFKKDVEVRSHVFFAFLVAICVLLGFYSLFVTILVPVFIAAIARVFYSWSGAEFKFCSFFHDFFVKFCEI